MRNSIIILFVSLLFFSYAKAEEQSIAGFWKTIDDTTKKPRSIVQLYVKDGELRAKIVKIFLREGEDENPVCDKCPGDKKNKPAMGMEILTGMEKRGDEWSGGHILDPDSGRSYRCRMRLTDNGQKLDVRGFIGISLLGRTQTWIRVSSPNG